MNIQPLLTSVKGTLADLVLSVDPAKPDQLQLYWGTVLLMVVLRDRDLLLFRIIAGLLASLKLNMTSLEECLEITGKTLRKWRNALLAGNWEPLATVFHGPGAETKLSPDVKQYVGCRYSEIIENTVKLRTAFARNCFPNSRTIGRWSFPAKACGRYFAMKTIVRDEFRQSPLLSRYRPLLRKYRRSRTWSPHLPDAMQLTMTNLFLPRKKRSPQVGKMPQNAFHQILAGLKVVVMRRWRHCFVRVPNRSR